MQINKIREQRKESLGNHNFFFKAYKDIVARRNQLDEQILSLQKKIISGPTQKVGVSEKRIYTKKNGSLSLKNAIREIMKTGEPMTMQNIIDCIEVSGLYKTKSKYLYVMINQLIGKSDDIKKIARGLYVMKKRAYKHKVKAENKEVVSQTLEQAPIT